MSCFETEKWARRRFEGLARLCEDAGRTSPREGRRAGPPRVSSKQTGLVAEEANEKVHLASIKRPRSGENARVSSPAITCIWASYIYLCVDYCLGILSSYLLSSAFLSLSLPFGTQIRGHIGGSSPPSPLRFVPCVFIARRRQPFLTSLTRVDQSENCGHLFSLSLYSGRYPEVPGYVTQPCLEHFFKQQTKLMPGVPVHTLGAMF